MVVGGVQNLLENFPDPLDMQHKNVTGESVANFASLYVSVG